MTQSDLQKLEVLLVSLKTHVEGENKYFREKLEDLSKSLDTRTSNLEALLKDKAAGWVETFAKSTMAIVLTGFLSGLVLLVMGGAAVANIISVANSVVDHIS